jgi:hypothetical protein
VLTLNFALTRRSTIKTLLAGAAVIPVHAQGALQIATATARRPEQTKPRDRQVHLDFHTSEHIPNVGKFFDKRQFQNALKVGRVNHINLFAKCHHSWSYYPTKVGAAHPNLTRDLLGAQIAACHEIGVRCPIYFTVGWSANDAEVHPEWCARAQDGSILTSGDPRTKGAPNDPKPQYQWKWLCPAATGPYHKLILRQVAEICSSYDVDGLWFDIYEPANLGCYCDPCRQRMAAEGVDLDDRGEVARSTARSIKEHMRQLRELVVGRHPQATVFFNQTPHPLNKPMFTERLFDHNTQQEIEDLPTAWGGYDKLPLEAKYHLGERSPVVAMSGKFHKAWGEFGGFKSADAIKYEAAAMIAFGAACNFGDQLHPSGIMDVETYRNIGEAYRYVEQIEDYGPGGLPYSKLGLWLTLNEPSDFGAASMLLEMHYDFVVANERNLHTLDALVIPSYASLLPAQAAAVSAWTKAGGKLVVMESGALDPERKRFVLDVGGTYAGASPNDNDYTVVGAALGTELVETPFLNYSPGIRVNVTGGEVLAHIREPYFNRTFGRYSGHANTPYKLENSRFPAAVRKGNTVFLAHPLDRLYHASGVRLHRQLLKNALDLLGVQHVVQVSGLPSSGRISLLEQRDQRRFVAHLLYSPALQRGDTKVIEDFPRIGDVKLRFRAPSPVKRARAIPTGIEVPFQLENGMVTLNVPNFEMHTAIVMDV